MIELPMVFMAGILGTAHCAGMCGPFALMIAGPSGRFSAALYRQSAYSAGRVFTYGTLGAAAGLGGQRLIQLGPALTNFPAVLAIAAGVLLIYQGLLAAGMLPKRAVAARATSCVSGGLLAHFIRRPGAGGIFLAGLFTGFLPCGLLYGMLALAMSTHSVAWGGLTMIVFGLGTVPAMMAIGLGGRLISMAARRRLLAAAAWCLLFAGAISIVRGISFALVGEKPAAGCPLCRQ